MHEILGMRKLVAEFTHSVKTVFNAVLVQFEEVFCRFETVDKIWIHWYIPKNKEQPRQWTLTSNLLQIRLKASYQPRTGNDHWCWLECTRCVSYRVLLCRTIGANCRKRNCIRCRKKCFPTMTSHQLKAPS